MLKWVKFVESLRSPLPIGGFSFSKTEPISYVNSFHAKQVGYQPKALTQLTASIDFNMKTKPFVTVV